MGSCGEKTGNENEKKTGRVLKKWNRLFENYIESFEEW